MADGPAGHRTGNPATDFSVALLTGLIRRGLRHVVVCPGSRSQALALVAAELERVGAVRLHVCIDERSAGFRALGIAVETGSPAAVITTSGTAAANLHPAVLEAHHSMVPLIALTADRPSELRGIRSNQTTEQSGLFGGAVRLSADLDASADDADAAAASAWQAALGGADGPGPVQLNIAFREPLSVAVPSLEWAVALGASADPGAAPIGPDAAEGRTDAAAGKTDAAAGKTDAAAAQTAAARIAPNIDVALTSPIVPDIALSAPVVQDVALQAAVVPDVALSAPIGSPVPERASPATRAAPPATEPRSPASELASSSPEAAPPAPEAASPAPEAAPSAPPAPELLAAGPRTIVVAGNGAGEGAEEVARLAGWPLIAEVSSGARFGPNLVVAYRELLDSPEFGGRVERAIVFGHPTLSRQVPALLSRDGVESIVVAPLGADFYNPGHRSKRVAAVELAADVDPRSAEARAWTGRWVFASRALVDEAAAASVDQRAPELEAVSATAPAERLAYVRGELAAVRAPVTRRMLVDAVWRFSWPHDRLVVAASRLVREADAAVAGKRIPVYSNRGLAGIDGTIATAIGVALARSDGDPRGITRVLIGDLALLHDVGSLLLAPTEERPRVQVIVGNDGGGTIFDSLEVAGSAPADAMDRVLLTPQEVDLASLARAYGWEHSRATNRGELDQALSAPPDSPSILEVPLGRRAP